MNTFGTLFRITSFGESHGPGIGVVVDGCPAGLALELSDIQPFLDRRRPGQSVYTSPRKETDTVRILSGVFKGKTLGSPIALWIANENQNSQDYTPLAQAFRPSHGDYSYFLKYGIAPLPGGGRLSARETLARVAAGAIAKKLLERCCKLSLIAYVERIGPIQIDPSVAMPCPTQEAVEASPVRSPYPDISAKMEALILEAKEAGDSLGGTILCRAQGMGQGWGEPLFDKLQADLAKAMLSLPAAKSFEIGSGLGGTYLKGSEHNDAFINLDGTIRTQSNHSGGIQGGISNGEELYFRVGFKAPSSITKPQATVSIEGVPQKLSIQGRHDPCVLPRAVPLVEAMTYLVLVDHFLRHQAYRNLDL